MLNPEQKFADAFRVIALRLEEALELGRRSKQITADNLLETLLSLATNWTPRLPMQNRRP